MFNNEHRLQTIENGDIPRPVNDNIIIRHYPTLSISVITFDVVCYFFKKKYF